jgi:transcriptional regulator with XRE-family HTH domain
MIQGLKEMRKSKKISGYELAKALGFKSPATYYKKEKGELPLTYKEMKKIAEYLNEPAVDIFFKETVS